MANRTVSVGLDLEVPRFVAGAKEAEKATHSLNDELSDVGDHGKDFAEAQADADKLTVAMKETSHEVDKTGTQMKETGADARFLADELAKAKRQALELAAAFTATGDLADLSAYKKQTRYVFDLEKLLKAVTPNAGSAATAAVPVAQNAVSMGEKLGRQLGLSAGQSFGDAFSGVLSEPAVWALAIPVLVDAGAMLGGVMLTGIGLAGIGAGIAGQIHDPRVGQAASMLGTEVSAGFKTATADFGQPLTDVLIEARHEWEKISWGVLTMFRGLAPEVRTLGGGLLGFVDNLAQPIEEAVTASRPLLDTFANWLPRAGEEFGGLLNTMSENAGTLNDGLKLVLGTVSGIVDLLNYATQYGSFLLKAQEWVTGPVDALIHFADAGGKASDVADHTADSVGALGAAAAQVVPSLNDVSKALTANTTTADQYAEALTDQLFSALTASDHASLGLAEAQSHLGEELKKNHTNIDITTQKGQDLRTSVLSVVEANIRIYDTMIKAGASADDAASAYDNNTAALEKQLQKAHVSKKNIDELIGSYRGVPDKVKTDIETNGLASALNNLGNLLAKINGLDGRDFGFTVTERHVVVEDRRVTHGSNTAYALGGQLPHAAAGAFFGPTDPGIVIAEPQTHGEWMIPQAGISQQRAYDLGSAAMAPHGLAVGRPAMVGVGGGGPSTLQLAATFVLPSGEVAHKQLITYALNTGRKPAELWPAVSR
jgi:ribosome-associated translation inhibitor RaiA